MRVILRICQKNQSSSETCVHPITVYGLIQMSPNTCAINVTTFEHRTSNMFCMFQNGGVPQEKNNTTIFIGI